MARVATQLLLGLMLAFGVLTLVPKGIVYIRLGNRARGGLYLVLGAAAAALSAVSFVYACMDVSGA